MRARFVSVQNEYSLLNHEAERDVLHEVERAGMAFVPYFPLANGLLTGKYRRGQNAPAGSRLDSGRGERLLTDRKLAVVERLVEFSERRGHKILELAFSWLLRRPAVASVIAGATSPRQARRNAAAASWKLTDKELTEIDLIVTSTG